MQCTNMNWIDFTTVIGILSLTDFFLHVYLVFFLVREHFLQFVQEKNHPY